MKKLLSFVFISFVCFYFAQNQIKITSSNSKKPLANAAVYCEDDLIGKTNTEGVLTFKTKCKKVEILANNHEAADAEVKKIMEVSLKPTAEKTGNIDRILITDKSDAKALQLLDEVNKRFKENSPKSLESYQFTGYSKLSIDVDRDSVQIFKAFLEKRKDSLTKLKRDFKQKEKKKKDSLIGEDFTETMQQSQMFLWEKASKYKFSQKYGDTTVIEDNRMSGFQNPIYEFLAVNVSNLNRVPRQISPENRKIYNYYMADTISLEGRKTYVIKFKEINNKLRQNPRKFNGKIYIDSENFALKKIESNSKKANEGNVISVWKPINNKWFLDYEELKIKAGSQDYTVVKKDSAKKGEKSQAIVKKFGNYLYVKNNFFDFKINPELPSEELSGYSLEIKNTDGKLLSQYRTDSLSQREEATYVKIDQFVQKNNFDKKISFITNLLKGNLRYKMIDIDLNRLFEVNRYEGVRLGAGIKLNEKFSSTFSPDFYFGYGFRDHTWKYGGGIDVKLSQKRTSILRLEYINDVFAAGRLSKTFWDNAMKTPDIGLDIYNLNYYKSEQFGISYTYDLSNSLSAKLIASKEQQNALFPYQYKNMGNSFENFNTSLSLKYSPNDKNLMTPAGKYTYEKGFPQIFVNFEIGSEMFGGQLNYQRIDALAIHQFRNKMGITNIKLFGGFSNGTAPIWKNFEITGQTNTNGNLRSKINTPSMLGFVTMPSGVFYTDRFVALQVSQLLPFQFKFGGKRTSSIQIEYQAAIGNHSNPSDHKFNFQVLNRPYQEIGFVWNRFLGTSLGVGASYRLGHYQTSEFKDNIGIQLKFGL